MKVANTYWADSRLSAQRPHARTLTIDTATPRERAVSKTESRRLGKISPVAFFTVVLMALTALCFTATLRAHAERETALLKHQTMSSNVEQLRNANTALAEKVRRVETDPRMVEQMARERLRMVRPDEMVVPVD